MRFFLPAISRAGNASFDSNPAQAFMQPSFADHQGSSYIATPQLNTTIIPGSSTAPTMPYSDLSGWQWQGTDLNPLLAYEDFSSNYENYLSHGVLPNHQMYEPTASVPSDAWGLSLSTTRSTCTSIETPAPNDDWLWASLIGTSSTAHTPEFSDALGYTPALSPLTTSEGTISVASSQAPSPAPVAQTSTRSASSVGCKRRKAGSARIHNDSDGNLVCSECNKCLSKLWRESVRRHWRESCPQNPNREKHRSLCSECGDSFTRPSSVKRHWMLRHRELSHSYPGSKRTRA